MKKKLYDVILVEIRESYSEDELKMYPNFESFYESVIEQNAYNESEGYEKFKSRVYKPYYKKAYKELIKNEKVRLY